MKQRDINLVNELRKNCRRCLTEIGRSIDKPLSTVFKAINRFYKEQVITRDTCLIDFARLGFPFKVGIFLGTDKKEELKKLLSENPNLNTLLRLSGDFDFYAELLFKDMASLQDFAEEMKQPELVKRINMHFITDVKREEFKIGGEE